MNPSGNSSNPFQTLAGEPAVAPVLASIVLLNGGSSAINRIPGKSRAHIFTFAQGAGINGRNAHVRNYTSLEEFHADQADLAQSVIRLPMLVRLYDVNPITAAKAAVEAFVKCVYNVPVKLERARELRSRLDVEILRPEKLTAPPEEDAQKDYSFPDALKPDNSPRAIRAAELRRCGEEYVRHVLREQYQISDVPVLNNPNGMIEAILNHEESMGLFDPKQEGAPAESPKPATTQSAAPTTTATDEPYSADVLAQMPIDDLKALSAKLGIPPGNRRTMAARIREKQGNP